MKDYTLIFLHTAACAIGYALFIALVIGAGRIYSATGAIEVVSIPLFYFAALIKVCDDRFYMSLIPVWHADDLKPTFQYLSVIAGVIILLIGLAHRLHFAL